MANYCDPLELRKEFLQFQLTGIMSDALGVMLGRIIFGISEKYADMTFEQREDGKQEFILLCYKNKDKIDTNKGCFNYLSTCAFNQMNKMYRERVREKAFIEKMFKRELM